ncbi:MAG: DUF1788 domain-containing protein [Dehalococcoidia bacterium]
MSAIEGLAQAYEERVAQPWAAGLSGPERVWLAIYDPAQERRLRFRLRTFETATRTAGHGWIEVDITDAFARWMAALAAREQYFANPQRMSMRLQQFTDHVAGEIDAALRVADELAVVAVIGAGAVFGVARVSEVVDRVAGGIRGRLLVFFPGQRIENNYRLFDARDGWNYLAVPIEAANGR